MMTENKLPELHPVVETPWFDGESPWPWPVADYKPFNYIRLSGELTHAEIGSVMAPLADWGQTIQDEPNDAELTVEKCVSDLLEADLILLTGGIQVCAGAEIIGPGCCCDINGWRGWLDGLKTGESPWMGHDPWPYLEYGEETIRVWSDGGHAPAPNTRFIDFERERFVSQVAGVEWRLRGFLEVAEAWAQAVGFSDPPALRRRLDADIGITGTEPQD